MVLPRVAWCCIAACSALACSATGLDRPAASQVASVVVDPASSTVFVGTEAPLRATAQDESGRAVPEAEIVWTVKDSDIVRVSASGVVSALAIGNTQVAANSNGHSAIATIAVRAVPVGSVTLVPATATIAVGQAVTLVPTVRDVNGAVLTNRTVTWSSSTPAVATVSTSGVVTGAGAGTATITATSEGQSASSAVTVTAPAPAPAPIPAPAASFIYSCALLSCVFANTSTNASSYSWNFGDGSALVTSTNATHTYARSGKYQVTLTAQRGSTSSSATSTVTVSR